MTFVISVRASSREIKNTCSLSSSRKEKLDTERIRGISKKFDRLMNKDKLRRGTRRKNRTGRVWSMLNLDKYPVNVDSTNETNL